MEVLNIANVNSSGEIVLNDRKLLELILRYPFVFSPEINPFGDIDYDNWAWDSITSELTNSYDPSCQVTFTPTELRQRWGVLQPIVLSLSKMHSLKGIPESFQQTVKKIGTLLEMPDRMPPPRTNAQSIVLQNIEKVEKLPLVQRRKLEAEVMELILAAEVGSKSTLEMGDLERHLLQRECYQFLSTIGFHKAIALFQEIQEDRIKNPSLRTSESRSNSTDIEQTVNADANDSSSIKGTEQPAGCILEEPFVSIPVKANEAGKNMDDIPSVSKPKKEVDANGNKIKVEEDKVNVVDVSPMSVLSDDDDDDDYEDDDDDDDDESEEYTPKKYETLSTKRRRVLKQKRATQQNKKRKAITPVRATPKRQKRDSFAEDDNLLEPMGTRRQVLHSLTMYTKNFRLRKCRVRVKRIHLPK